MLCVYYSRFTHQFTPEESTRLASTIKFDPDFSLDRFHRWQDAPAHLTGRLQLTRGLAALGVESLPVLQYTDHCRPYVDLPLDFSISHSGEYVL